MNPHLRRVVREPLVHFLLVGAALFAVWSWTATPESDGPEQIVITQGEIEAMAVGFNGTWRRPPTRDELDGLIRDRVREEVYSREARALGLDRDDLIIRRRLRQKMEFLTEDVVAHAEPTEADLITYLETHPDAFRVERSFSFVHVYLSPAKRGEAISSDATALLVQLNVDDSQWNELGDPFLLEHEFASIPAAEITKLFGESFSQKLGTIAPGQWAGPVESGYGMHLVKVSERTEGRVPALAEVRDAVRREWANTRRLESNEKLYDAMLKRYQVSIDRPAERAGVAVNVP